MFSVTIFSGILFILQVSALTKSPLPRSDTPIMGLASRQSTSPEVVPTACQSTCQSYLDISDSCDSSTCICTETLGRALVSCANCVVSQPGTSSSERTDQQAILDTITSSCKSDGLPFSKPLELSSSAPASSVPSKALAALGIVAVLMAVSV